MAAALHPEPLPDKCYVSNARRRKTLFVIRTGLSSSFRVAHAIDFAEKGPAFHPYRWNY
jgi:hypothetical protein